MRISDWSSDVCSSDLSAATAFVPARADIVDRNGVPLARTIDGYSIRVVPSKLLNDRQYLAAELHKIFPDMTRQDLLAKLTGPRPTYIRRRALPDQVAAVNAVGHVGFALLRDSGVAGKGGYVRVGSGGRGNL